MDPQFEMETMALAQIIDQLDYYRILQVERNASLGQIRSSYHKQARLYHPDRYYHLAGGPFKEAVAKISKRVADAYVVLRDAGKRQFYDQQLAQTEGKSVRYTETSAQQQKLAKQQEFGKTEKTRRLYRQGMQELQRNNFEAAARAFKMAAAYEPDNDLFKEKAKEAEDQIKTDYRIR
jgi:curved DNA-binding protein CbpA